MKRVLSGNLDALAHVGMALCGASWAVLVTHIIWFCILGHEMAKFWGMRKKLRIHARSPMLALVSGMGGSCMQFVIMIFEISAQEGTLIPCVVMLYSNAIVIAFYCTPYLLRGLRIVIISDKEWRAKYSVVLSRQNVLLMIATVFIAMSMAAVMLQFVSPQSYGAHATNTCFAIGDWWFYGPASALLAAVSSKLFLELARVQDRIHMSKEISSAASSWLACGVPYYTVKILDFYDVVQAPRQMNFVLSGCILLTAISTFFIEPRRHKGELQICAGPRKKKVVVVLDEPQIAAWKATWHNSKVIMAEPAIDHAFEKHVQDFLCSESYDFLKEVDRYVASATKLEVDQLFTKFREIVDVYILAGSELEVNIETAMRNKILKIGDHESFVKAEAGRRRDIFNPSGTEIRKMLDENLLKTFLLSTAFLHTCKHLEEKLGQSSSTSTMAEPVHMEAGFPLVPRGQDGPIEQGIEDCGEIMSLAQTTIFHELN